MGPDVPARRQDARHREAGPAARRQRRRQDDVGAGRRPAGGGRARPGRPARRRARSGVPDESADLLELRRARRRTHEQHRGRARPVRRRRRAEGRERAGHLPPGAVAQLDRCTSAAGSCSARDGTLFVTLGDRSITEGRMQAQNMDSLLGKIVRINADGSIPKDNPFVGKEGVRPEIWSYRPPQRAGRDAPSRDRRAVGSRARHARRRRAQHRAQGQGLRLADDRLRHRVPGPADHRRHPAAGRHGAAASTTGIRSSRRAA